MHCSTSHLEYLSSVRNISIAQVVSDLARSRVGVPDPLFDRANCSGESTAMSRWLDKEIDNYIESEGGIIARRIADKRSERKKRG